MKTLTEFNGFQLKNGIAKLQELATASKTEEEQSAGIAEAFKLEGDKLKFFLNAVRSLGTKAEGVKRVIVLTLAENEKAPQGAVKPKGAEADEQYYITEYFPGAAPRGARGARDERGGRDERGDRKGKRGKGRGGRGERGGRGGRGREDQGSDRRGPHPGTGAEVLEGAATGVVGEEGPATGGSNEGGEQKRRRRPRRTPRPPLTEAEMKGASAAKGTGTPAFKPRSLTDAASAKPQQVGESSGNPEAPQSTAEGESSSQG